MAYRAVLAGWLFGMLQIAQPAAADALHFVTEPFPPFTFERNGEGAGPMADILQAACVSLDLQCHIDVMPWRRALALAERGLVDGIFTVVDIPERRAMFHISVPVLDARYALFAVAASTQAYRTPNDLAGRIIGVYGPSATATTLAALIEGVDGARISLETDNLTALKKLAAGRYGPNGMVLANHDVAEWLIADHRVAGLEVVGMVKLLSYSFGLSRVRISDALATRFNQALLALCRDGQTRRIAASYRLVASKCTEPPGA